MLSVRTHISKECRTNVLKNLGLCKYSSQEEIIEKPVIWLRSAKMPFDGEGLGDKGFEFTDRIFAWFNQVRTPRVLRKRDVKQHDIPELVDKNLFCKGRHTIEVAFSFLENVDSLKDTVPFENVSMLPHALEWGHAIINLNMPLRTPGSKSGLPNMC